MLERLRQLAAALPPGASITLERELLAQLVEDLGGVAEPLGGTSVELTAAQLAGRFQRSPSTVRGWLEAGRFPGAYKLRGRDWRVPQSAVSAFVTAQGADGPLPPPEPRTSRDAADLGRWRRMRRAAP